ncbi:hypothetical protein Tco_0438695 [Tanacetum coccineum]
MTDFIVIRSRNIAISLSNIEEIKKVLNTKASPQSSEINLSSSNAKRLWRLEEESHQCFSRFQQICACETKDQRLSQSQRLKEDHKVNSEK